MITTDLATYTIVVISALVHGLLGFGFPMLATPLLAFNSNVRTAIVTLLLPTLAINLVNVIRGGHWNESIGRYWPLAVFGGIGSLVGTQLLVLTDPEPYKLLMSAMILVYLNVHRLGIGRGWLRRHVLWASILCGLVGGMLAGTVNVMLPALIIFALEVNTPPLVTIQIFNFSFFVGKLSQGTVLVYHGYLNAAHFLTAIPIIFIAVLAMGMGIRFRECIKSEVYRVWLKRTLAGIAILLFMQYLSVF